ncbi:MAG TPA: DUF3866 family protein [Gaiellaceae bacterium]|nr:DUF3866 family protein [Gaiellaceae bacterium]
MPVTLRSGTVTAIAERHDGLVRLEVDGRACVAYPGLTGPVALGDDVLVNVQAVELGLGSGGFDVLHANLTRGLGLPADDGAHVMKLPYSPLQHAVLHAEEGWDEGEGDGLAGLPVVCCSLHSQVAPACAGLGRELAVAYVQLAGGALPLPLSGTVRTLREQGLLRTTVSVGPCVGGELDCVSAASALVASARAGMDAVVCAIGPGVVGTGSRYGHGATTAADAANAARALGGRPVLAPRVSTADERERHRGLSHHTLAVLELAGGEVDVAWPAGLEVPEELPGAVVVDASGWRAACEWLPLSHMGRGPDEEPWFFAASFAAGALARSFLS